MNVYLVTLFSEATPHQFAGHFLQFPSGVELAYAVKVEREESSAANQQKEEHHGRSLHQCAAFASRTAWVSTGKISNTSPTMP